MANDDSRARRAMRMATRVLLPVLVIVVAVAVAATLVKTGPHPRRGVPREEAALVETTELSREKVRIAVEAIGTVEPARAITLQARVGGRIEWVSARFRAGGRFAEGEPMARIDRTDYALAVENRKSDVAAMNQAYQLELGQQAIARHEWELIPDRAEASDLERSLTLREPHLAAAEAALAGSQASLEKARIDLARAEVTAPFNLVVTTTSVEVGAEATTQTALATVAGSDEYWVDATVPVSELDWIRWPGPDGAGSPARVRPTGETSETGGSWPGEVIELLPEVEEQGRMARVLVSIPDPLGTSPAGTPLLLGSYVRVEIEGREVEDVFALPRSAVHEGNRVWIVGSDNRLEVRAVDALWSGAETVLVADGLEEGERLVVSDLARATAGVLCAETVNAAGAARSSDGASLRPAEAMGSNAEGAHPNGDARPVPDRDGRPERGETR